MEFLRRLFTCKNSKEEKNENIDEPNKTVPHLLKIGN